jgi:hypothetical protein
MGKKDQVVPESLQALGPSEPSKPFVPTGRRFRVGRSFRAGGEMQPRGSVIEEQPWKNFNALVKTGYLIPIYADAVESVADGS